jgi:asparagine synthase (glutamine-hydrolysing)
VSALAGVWRFDGKPEVDADCSRMLAAQRIYGPHDERQWCEGSLGMGRGLFRLLPEDVHDHQPLQSRDGRLTLVADVRLDNREDLVAEFGLPSAEARELCDAAILLESLDRWGEQALRRLVGDFAFVLWDAPAQRLLLARDFIGQRPLHYHCGRGFFAFASMAKGLHALAEIPYGPDEQLVAELVVLMPRQGPRSFFRDIARVEPAHVVTVTRNGVSSRRYWEPQRPRGSPLRSSDYVEGLRHHLDQATQSRLRGIKGAVATHLSSGLDSSAVTATAARLLNSRGGKVVAFTAVPRVGYDGSALRNCLSDEGPLATATATMYPNIEHVLIRCGHNSPLDGLDRGFYLCDRPTLNPCNRVWLSAINQAARERGLNILLVGAIGNMSVSYNGLELLPELLLMGRLISLWREASRLRRKGGLPWRRVLSETFGPFMPLWLWQWVERRAYGQVSNVLDYTAIRADCLAERNLAALARERDLDFYYRPWKDGFAMRLWVMSRIDNAEVNKGILAGWGIDWRDPLADKRLVEYCLGVPTEEYLADGVPRALARRAFSDRLPSAVLNERRMGLQAVDWHEGLTAARSEVAAEVDRLAACAPAAKVLDVEKMKRLIENWPTSGWEREEIEDRYRFALLRGISAGHFLRKTMGANQ